jgi:transposase
MAPQWLTIVSKFGDFLPFYRQAGIFKRQGIDPDRGTLGNWGENRSRRDRTVQWTGRRDERAKRRAVARFGGLRRPTGATVPLNST